MNKFNVPRGFVLVPKEPTAAMIEAGARDGVDGNFDTLSNSIKELLRKLAASNYRAMIAAYAEQTNDSTDIPRGVYFRFGNFYGVHTRSGMGTEFLNIWYGRRNLFPTSPEDAE